MRADLPAGGAGRRETARLWALCQPAHQSFQDRLVAMATGGHGCAIGCAIGCAFCWGARLCRLMGLLASLRSDDSDQGVSFDTLVGTLVETSEGGSAPPCGLNNNPALASLYSSYALSFDPLGVVI